MDVGRARPWCRNGTADTGVSPLLGLSVAHKIRRVPRKSASSRHSFVQADPLRGVNVFEIVQLVAEAESRAARPR